MRNLEGAVEKYRAALQLFPEHVGIRTNLAVALLKLGQWDEGLAQMREALRPARIDPCSFLSRSCWLTSVLQ